MSGREDEPRLWRWEDPIEELAEVVANGGVLALPTESSYALAVDPCNRRAVESVFRLKGRPAGRPLPVIAGDFEQIRGLGAAIESRQEELLRLLWPESLTVVLPIRHPVAASAGRPTLAVRIPKHTRLRHLLLTLGTALTATSANRSSEAPIVDPQRLGAVLGAERAVIVDDGELAGGEPSTIVRPAGDAWTMIRQGAFPSERLREVIAPAGGRVVGIDGVELGVRG